MEKLLTKVNISPCLNVRRILADILNNQLECGDMWIIALTLLDRELNGSVPCL